MITRRRSTRRFWVIGIAATVAALVSACASNTGAPSTNDATIVIAQTDHVGTLDPAQPPGNRQTEAVNAEIFDALVTRNNALQYEPQLATSWSQPSPTQWVFKLRAGVKFTDGEPFNAAAVKYTLDRVLNPAEKADWYSQLSPVVANITTEGDNTVVITTKSPAPTLLEMLSYQCIVPPAYIKRVGDKVFGEKPVGTGPFKFQSRNGDSIKLVANTSYWGGAPKISNLDFTTILDPSAEMAALQSGEVQIAAGISPDSAKTLGGGLKLETDHGTELVFLSMNVTKPPFNDHALRVAMNEAVNQQLLVNTVLDKYARPLNQPAFPEMFGYDTGKIGYTYDPAAARKVFATLKKPFVLAVGQPFEALAEAVAGELRAAGAKVQVRVEDSGALDDSEANGSFQAYIDSWGVGEGDTAALMKEQFWSEGEKTYFASGYHTPQLDALIGRGNTLMDSAARKAVLVQALQDVVAAAPWVPLANPTDLFGVSTSVHGWTPSPLGFYNLLGVTRS